MGTEPYAAFTTEGKSHRGSSNVHDVDFTFIQTFKYFDLGRNQIQIDGSVTSQSHLGPATAAHDTEGRISVTGKECRE